jgi:hypothetical protein
VVLSDEGAEDYLTRVTMPIFRDPNGDAWLAFRSDALKHDTFVYDADGKLVLSWRISDGSFVAKIGAAVRMLPP